MFNFPQRVTVGMSCLSFCKAESEGEGQFCKMSTELARLSAPQPLTSILSFFEWDRRIKADLL